MTETLRFFLTPALFYRLFHAILNLRQVLESSAHWLLLLDKSQYHYDQSKPFLHTVTFDLSTCYVSDLDFTLKVFSVDSPVLTCVNL